MNAAIAGLTFRQLVGKRRSAVMVLFGLLPIVIAIIYRFASNVDVEGSPLTGYFSAHQEWTAKVLMADFIIGSLLPIAALSFGTAALGSEFEDGTAPYLLAKPIPRWRILLSKVVISWAVTAVLILVVVLVSGFIALAGQPTDAVVRGRLVEFGNGYGIILGFAVASVLGALVYNVLFVLLSIVTSRAFISGLIYVFLWEGVVTRLFTGTRIFSVRQYCLGVADAFANVSSNVFNPPLGAGIAFVMIVVVAAFGIYFGIRQLERWEIGETA